MVAEALSPNRCAVQIVQKEVVVIALNGSFPTPLLFSAGTDEFRRVRESISLKA